MTQFFWKNKRVFILAAIGSAAWLGNLWRFPYMVYENGWWTFIIAYLIVLLLMWIGLLIWEIALGQYTQKWAPGAFGEVKPYLRWLWWAGILTASVILTYYVVVIGRWIDYLVYSLYSLFAGVSLPWAGVDDFFTEKVLQLTDDISQWWGISWPVFWGTLLAWILIYAFTYKSADSVGKVVMITATFPFLTLLILAIRWATLPWAEQWLVYLTTIDWAKLTDLKIWTAAAWQIFFTLSIAMGIMIAYGALKRKDTEIVQSTILVAIWNTIISFLSAIAVFGTLWYMAAKSGEPITEVISSWPILAFVTFPEAIVQLPALNTLFAVIFFVTIFMLAIDSAMSLIEAVGVALREKFKNVPIEILTLIIVVILWLGSMIYVFGNGLYILDIVDHFINAYSMLFIWLVEAIVFLLLWKKLWQFIDEHNECFIRFVINKWYFLLSWLISIFVLGYLLFDNIRTLFVDWLVYWWYPKAYLIMRGVYILVGIYVISILINIIEIYFQKKQNKELSSD